MKISSIHPQTGQLTVQELQHGLNHCIKHVQRTEFTEDLRDLMNLKLVSPKNKLKTLSPFNDKDRLIKVGVRIQKSSAPYNQKHPIVLPVKNQLMYLIVKHEPMK